MNDRELLESAAKAAGVEYVPKQFSQFGLWLVIHGEPSEYQRRYWNPLKDDGDALRLAVKLDMMVDPVNRVVAGYLGNICVDVDYDQQESDPYAATRRAIVLAAANTQKL